MSKPIEEQWTYFRENLKAVMKELSPLMRDKQFKNFLKEEATKKFDGGFEVLVKSIIENPLYSPRINKEKIEIALKAFWNIEGHNYYPHIYIPFLESNHSQMLVDSPDANPPGDVTTEFVVYDGNEGTTEVPSYIYNEEGDIIPTGSIVNEQYALNNEIYVIAINEIVNDGGEITPDPPPPPPPPPGAVPVNFRIKDLTIKDGKESWLAGASEIHIKSNGTTWSHIIDGNTSGYRVNIPNLRYAGPDELKAHEIRKIPRGEIGYPIFNINYIMNTNWIVDNFYVDPIVYTYVIFEYDAVPAGRKILQSKIPSALTAGNDFDNISFRSSNTAYGGTAVGYPSNVNYAIYGNVSGLPSSFTYLYYDGFHLNTQDIEFNTVKY